MRAPQAPEDTPKGLKATTPTLTELLTGGPLAPAVGTTRARTRAQAPGFHGRVDQESTRWSASRSSSSTYGLLKKA